jgi:hypothetical protein
MASPLAGAQLVLLHRDYDSWVLDLRREACPILARAFAVDRPLRIGLFRIKVEHTLHAWRRGCCRLAECITCACAKA